VKECRPATVFINRLRNQRKKKRKFIVWLQVGKCNLPRLKGNKDV
jgi:hypothetical protein